MFCFKFSECSLHLRATSSARTWRLLTVCLLPCFYCPYLPVSVIAKSEMMTLFGLLPRLLFFYLALSRYFSLMFWLLSLSTLLFCYLVLPFCGECYDLSVTFRESKLVRLFELCWLLLAIGSTVSLRFFSVEEATEFIVFLLLRLDDWSLADVPDSKFLLKYGRLCWYDSRSWQLNSLTSYFEFSIALSFAIAVAVWHKLPNFCVFYKLLRLLILRCLSHLIKS